MKRYTLKLGVAVVSLAAAYGGTAIAQTRGTATDLAFRLAMAASTGDNPAAPAIPAPSQSSTPASAAVSADSLLVAAKPPPPSAGPVATPTTPGPDGLVEGGAYIEADDVREMKDKTVVAYGHVEMRYKSRTIRADQISYDPNTKITIATGHTVTINDDGSVQFADQVTYNSNMSAGSSENFADLGADQTKIFARRVDRLNENTNQMTGIIYTPCQLCASHGVTQPPTWSISATKITQRKDKRMVYYDNATILVKNVPVFYAPLLWTPDPEMPRASGLLQPKPGHTRRRGFSLEQPYLWVLEPYSYLIIDPQFNSRVNPMLNLQFRRRFYSGDLNLRFGFTNESFFDNAGRRIGNAETRDYILADGAFKINRNWRWSFTAQHAKDPNDSINPATGKPYGDNANFFERYSIDDAFDQRGELSVDARELINQVNLTRQTKNAFFSLSMASFQTLQIAGYEPVTAETTRPFVINNDIFPTVAPLLEAYWSPKSDILGGQFTVGLTGIGLQHKLYPGDAVAPQAEILACANQVASCKTGFDTSRLTALASWTVDKVWGTSGFKGGPFLNVRHDYYHESELSSSGLKTDAERDLATAGINVAYPLFQRYKGVNVVVSPIAQLALSPKYQANPDIPTEDSQTLEFDQSTLFTVNRSPGFDVYESGARLNIGVRTDFVFDKGLKINALVGRTLRDDVQTQFLRPANDPTNGQTATDTSGTTVNYDPYGLAYKGSDWIADGDFDTGKGLYGYGRVRLDSDTLRLKQGEAGLSVYSPRTEATIRYIVNNNNPVVDPITKRLISLNGPNYRNLQFYARHFITSKWGVSARLDRDMLTEKWRRSTVSVIYRDDCLWLELIYERNDTVLNTVNGKPQSGFLFQIKPLILGMNGATQFHDVR